MRFKSLVAGVVTVLTLGFASQGFCTSMNGTPSPLGDDPPLFVGGGWQQFTWDGPVNVLNQEGPFTFTSSFATVLTVTDAFVVGDRFDVFDFGTLLGATSAPAKDGTYIDDFPSAVLDPKFSSGQFLLAAGSHSITLKTIEEAPGYFGGGGGLRADPSAVPEPATFVLLGVGGVLVFLRKKLFA